MIPVLAQAAESLAEPAVRFVERAPDPGLVSQYGPLLAGLLALGALIYTFVSRTGEAFEKGIKNYLGTDGGRETLDKAIWNLLKGEDFAKWLAEKGHEAERHREEKMSAGLAAVVKAVTDLSANVSARLDLQSEQLGEHRSESRAQFAELRAENKTNADRLRKVEIGMARIGSKPFVDEGEPS